MNEFAKNFKQLPKSKMKKVKGGDWAYINGQWVYVY